MTAHFGEHLTIDGYGGNEAQLNDKDLILKLLHELPAALDMHTLTEPQVVMAPDNQLKDPGGYSGFVIIAESHISIHTFPKRGFVSADVYTCRDGMNTEFVVQYFKDKFGLQEVETNFIIRGTNYPLTNIT